MTNLELTTKFFKQIEQRQWHSVADLLAENFVCYGPLPDPLERDTWLDLLESLSIAFPDWTFNVHEVHQLMHDKVEVTLHIKGTHLDSLDLSILDFKPIPASGLKLEIPDEIAVLTFDNDKIISLMAGEKIHHNLIELISELEMD
jgi:hypothetical protein